MMKRTAYSTRPVTRAGPSKMSYSVRNWLLKVMFSDVKHAAGASIRGAVVLELDFASGGPVGKRVLSRSANMTPARLNTAMMRTALSGPRSQLEK